MIKNCITLVLFFSVHVFSQDHIPICGTPDPTEEEIRHGLEGNFCRCTGYHNIVKSIKAAAVSMQGGA